MLSKVVINFGTSFKLKVTLILSLGFSAAVNSYKVDDNPYRHREIVDPKGKYELEWLVQLDQQRIIFNVTVETRGFVALGLNRKPQMAGADIVIVGVDPNGTPYISDRHATGRQMPVEDSKQDWTLHEAHETRTHTMLTFSRAFETCDDEFDLPLEVQGDLTSVLWAYGESDDIGYHFENRGSFYVYLLDPEMTTNLIENASPFGNFVDGDIKSVGDWNVWTLSKSQPIPSEDAAYICTLHKAPNHNKKLHVVGFRSIFKDEISRRHIHHYLLHRCRPPSGIDADKFFGPSLKSPGELCFIMSRPATGSIPHHYCQEVVHVWAVNGKSNFFPEHVGLPISESSGSEYFVLQVHFDNPERRVGMEANFALEVFYTDKLRENDAGVIMLGTTVPGSPSILIPPGSTDHIIYGHCGSECTKKIFPKTGINVFAVLLHTHLKGTGLQVKHIRKRTELPDIIHDDNYDFNYQQIRTLNQERTILPGDSAIIKCFYETVNGVQRSTTTVGGFSTRNEMCSPLLYYYPYIRSGVHGLCASEITSETYENFLGIRNTTFSSEVVENIVTSPRRNAGLTVSQVGNNIEWTSEKRKRLQQLQRTLPQMTFCPNMNPDDEQAIGGYEFESVYDEGMTPYEPQNVCQV